MMPPTASRSIPVSSILLDQSGPIVRRVGTIVIGRGVTPPAPVPTSYFIRTPRSWTLTRKLDF